MGGLHLFLGVEDLMITNLPGLTAYLEGVLRKYRADSRTQNAVVGLSGGIDSAVVFALCCRAFRHSDGDIKRTDGGTTIGVMMPCHSSEASLTRANEIVKSQLALGYVCRGFEVPLETAFHSIANAVAVGANERLQGDAKACTGALRSCLRAPVLDYVSKSYNSLVYGTGNRDEDEIFRYYQKRGDGAVDNNIIVGLHKAEVRQLAAHLGLPQSVLDAVPTADLWGADASQTDEGELGLTYDEIEWVTRTADTHQILELRGSFEPDEDGYISRWEDSGTPCIPLEPAIAFRKQYADKFSDRQFEIIEKAFSMEKSSRHKASPPPGPRRDDISFFVI